MSRLRNIKSVNEDPAQALALMAATGAHEMMLAEIKRLEAELKASNQSIEQLNRSTIMNYAKFELAARRVKELEIELEGYRTARDA